MALGSCASAQCLPGAGRPRQGSAFRNSSAKNSAARILPGVEGRPWAQIKGSRGLASGSRNWSAARASSSSSSPSPSTSPSPSSPSSPSPSSSPSPTFTGASALGLVLGLAADGEAWDCGGVGRPVVRRNLNGEEESWLMWYEGWGAALPKAGDAEGEDKGEGEGEGEEGVPSSCIGLALSANGLLWTRGSATVETDARGQGGAGRVLAPSANWWSFDTRHVRSGDVIIMASPTVRSSGGVFWMYYEGTSREALPLPEGTPPGRAEALTRAVGARGGLLRSRPGLALSNDGRNWASIEGEHHSGSLFDVGEDGEWDSSFIGSPHVVFHAPGDLRMYYHALDADSPAGAGALSIGVARSRDGIRWVKWGKALAGASVHPGSLGCVNAHVLPDPGGLGLGPAGGAEETTTSTPGGYVMVYQRVSEDGQGSICLATSPDGLSNWTHSSVLLEPSADPSAWDSVSVGAPCLVDMGGGKLRVYYQGQGPQGSCGIGVAERAAGSSTFERLPMIAGLGAW